MKTLDISKKNKLISLPEDALKKLSILVTEKGTSLKRFIEDLLIEEARVSEAYTNYLRTEPAYRTSEEQAEFENWLGV